MFALQKKTILCPACNSELPPFTPGKICPRCTLSEVLGSSSSEINHGPEIENLILYQEIGEGGFGIVYRAEQTRPLRRDVALKVMKPGLDTRQILRRFEIEQQALAYLEHPNIARIYEAGQTKDGYPYFTMEFVEGNPIDEVLQGLAPDTILPIFLQICEALSHAHDRGVLHRDLKPGNILVTPEGIPKVIDFGLAKALDASQAPGMTLYTGGESWLGTLGYAAPEQLDPTNLDLDQRADVYSLGAILFHLLTGISPHEARQLHDSKKLPKPSAIALHSLSSDLNRIVCHALEEDKEERYSSVSDLADDLNRFRNDENISIRPEYRKLQLLIGVTIPALIIFGYLAFKEESSPSVPPPFKTSIVTKLDGYHFQQIGFFNPDSNQENGPGSYIWFTFEHPEQDKLTLAFDSWYDSPSVTEFIVGARSPDSPDARPVPFSSPEDSALATLLLDQREDFIGHQTALTLGNIRWEDLTENEEDLELRTKKLLLGALLFFEDQRKLRSIKRQTEVERNRQEE